ncbi:hypothetical protein DID88_002215 [Monilinia fructigena]|uniref:Uncharacterized protein n=1 Tax=Monilinia fructigena TaxID=38457 RepID=A0A395IWT1_9HELO|nr:hypothetical protein DID88_002215 [Monilinia fructigena]
MCFNAPMTKEQMELYNKIGDKTADLRKYLEEKVVERLSGSKNIKKESSKPVEATVKVEATVEDSDSEDEKPLAIRTVSVRSRDSRSRRVYEEADASEEDELSDDEFETKLAAEYAEKEEAELKLKSQNEDETARILELARKEISSKKLGNLSCK